MQSAVFMMEKSVGMMYNKLHPAAGVMGKIARTDKTAEKENCFFEEK